MEAVKELRNSFRKGILKDLSKRKEVLKSMYDMLTQNEDAFCEAIFKDMKKCKTEFIMTEMRQATTEISSLTKNLDHWTANQKVSKTFVSLTDTAYIQKQPFGVLLTISSWNYPLSLSIQPAAGAIAAGNCCIIKPSELSENMSKLLGELIPKYVDQNVCRCVTGGIETAQALLKEKFDYIIYTGSSAVGKIVMEAAAKHLTPVTLELGGKSPCYVDRSVDMHMAAKRITWGKYCNVGQTCIAPDYILCHEEVHDQFVKAIEENILEFYGEDASKSDSFGRIINARHFERLRKLIESSKSKLVTGGKLDSEERFIAPTVFVDVTVEDSLMSEELFGPIMPIIKVKNADHAIEIINDRPKPLSLYVFSKSSSVIHELEDQTSSGGFMSNDVMVHSAIETLPFGGVGESGMGYYHGEYSIDMFQHQRAILHKHPNETMNNLFRYPPYNEKKLSWVNWALKSNPNKGYCTIL